MIIIEVALTKISKNGQIVIPADIRRDAKLRAETKFLVFNEGDTIVLKQIRKEALKEDIKLIEKIQTSEEDVKKGRFVKVRTAMKNKEIDDLLMG